MAYPNAEAVSTLDVAHLEQKVMDLEAQLQKAFPRGSSPGHDGDHNSQVDAANHQTASLPALFHVDSVVPIPLLESDVSESLPRSSSRESYRGLEEILGTSLHNEVASSDHHISIYRGRTPGFGVLRDLRHLCDSFMGLSLEADYGATALLDALDGSAPVENLATLPMLEIFLSGASVSRWIDLAFDQAFVLWPFIDRELLNDHVQRLIGSEASEDTGNNNDSLGLIHAIIALGQRHDTNLIRAGDWRSHTAETRGHQLGILATLSSLSDRERAVRQRVYMTLRVLDAYITSSLGLPRNFSATQIEEGVVPAPQIGEQEMLTAAIANADLLSILNRAQEQVSLKTFVTPGHGSIVVDTSHIHEFEELLGKWMLKYHISTDGSAADAPVTCTNQINCYGTQCRCHLLTLSGPTLFLKYSRCFVLLVVWSPLLHHIVEPSGSRCPSAYAAATRCVEAAMEAVSIAETMGVRGMLYEAWALTVDVLAMAATSLLFVELGAPGEALAGTVRPSSRKAKALLESLAWQSCTAARCLESLKPLYIRATTSTSISTVPAAQIPQDIVLGPLLGIEIPVWDFEQVDYNLALAYESIDTGVFMPCLV